MTLRARAALVFSIARAALTYVMRATALRRYVAIIIIDDNQANKRIEQ